MLEYEPKRRAVTQGTGTYSIVMERYEPVSAQLQDKSFKDSDNKVHESSVPQTSAPLALLVRPLLKSIDVREILCASRCALIPDERLPPNDRNGHACHRNEDDANTSFLKAHTINGREDLNQQRTATDTVAVTFSSKQSFRSCNLSNTP